VYLVVRQNSNYLRYPPEMVLTVVPIVAYLWKEKLSTVFFKHVLFIVIAVYFEKIKIRS
jgi:hypothetical protein